jgi:hypothetical protein
VHKLVSTIVVTAALALSGASAIAQEATTMKEEHVRHMRAHKKPSPGGDATVAQTKEAPKPSKSADATVKQGQSSARSLRPEKEKRHVAKVKPKAAVEKKINQSAPERAVERPRRAGFVEELFDPN